LVKTRREYGSIEITDVPMPETCHDEDVIVEVKSAAICGSDLHVYEYLPTYQFIKVPVIIGHEFSGIVKEVGPKVTAFKLGDRVMGESVKYCGYCKNCRTGNTHICYQFQMRGLHVDGCMSEFKKIGEKFLHHLPEGLSFNKGAAAQACTVSTHALVDRTPISPGDIVVVFGPGIVGQIAAQLAKVKGAGEVFLVGTNQDEGLRLEMGRSMGFHIINVEKQNLQEELTRICGAEKVDVAIECSGAAKALKDCVSLLRRGGHLTIVGMPSQPIELNVALMVRSELTVNMSYSSKWDNYEKTLDYLAKGILYIKPLLKEYPFDLAESAFEDALAKRVVKPVLIL